METNAFSVLKREDVSPKNQLIFDQLKKQYGAVPNLYSTLAYSENALDAYTRLEAAKLALSPQEIEAVNLVVSEVNQCIYCLSAHTMVAKSTGFSEPQTIEIRSGNVTFDPKLNALVRLAKELTDRRRVENEDLLNAFYEAGYTRAQLVDLIILVGDRTISNILHAVTKVPVEFPLAKSLD